MTGNLNQFVAENTESLLAKNGVESVGVGQDEDGNPTVVVGVESISAFSVQEKNEVESLFPQDVPHEFREVGRFDAEILKTQADPTGKFRPVIQGVSCGHPNVTAGTTGLVYENDAGETFVGSNNHVLADTNVATVGDTQLQPGTADGGAVGSDDFGTLAYFKTIEDGVTVDLALALASASVENSVNDINQPVVGSVQSVSVGDTLIKSGRTTGVTTGTVDQVNASVSVNYGDATYTISDCIITGDMSDGGDSGSATWLEQSDGLYAAGRLFAGSSSATVHHAYRNEIAALQNEFDSSISLVTDGGGDVPTATLDVTLTKTAQDTGNIEVTVRSDVDGLIEGATVEISGETSDTATTDAQGMAVFTGVPIGSYTVTMSATDHDTVSRSVTSGDFT